MMYFSAVSSFWWGEPQEVSAKFCVYPGRRTDIWSPLEPQAPLRERHTHSANVS